MFSAEVTLTAAIGIICSAAKFDRARRNAAIALPTVTLLDLAARFKHRKWLHVRRQADVCVQRVVAIGYADSVASLASALGTDSHHGPSVVGVCLADKVGEDLQTEVATAPMFSEIEELTKAVDRWQPTP